MHSYHIINNYQNQRAEKCIVSFVSLSAQQSDLFIPIYYNTQIELEVNKYYSILQSMEQKKTLELLRRNIDMIRILN